MVKHWTSHCDSTKLALSEAKRRKEDAQMLAKASLEQVSRIASRCQELSGQIGAIRAAQAILKDKVDSVVQDKEACRVVEEV